MTEGRRELLDVTCRSADDRAPRGAVVYGEHPVVVQETHEKPGGKGEHRRRVGRPDRRTHRHYVVLGERATVTPALQQLAERHLAAGLVEQCRRLTVEAQDVANHPEESRAKQVASLREQRIEAGAVVFQATRLVTHREAHAALLGGDTQFLQKPDEIRVGAVVEYDETGVHLPAAAALFDGVRVRVAAEVARRLVERDVVFPVQPVCGDIAGNATADDCDFHAGVPAARTACRSRIATGTGRRSQTTPSAASSRRA